MLAATVEMYTRRYTKLQQVNMTLYLLPLSLSIAFPMNWAYWWNPMPHRQSWAQLPYFLCPISWKMDPLPHLPILFERMGILSRTNLNPNSGSGSTFCSCKRFWDPAIYLAYLLGNTFSWTYGDLHQSKHVKHI